MCVLALSLCKYDLRNVIYLSELAHGATSLSGKCSSVVFIGGGV